MWVVGGGVWGLLKMGTEKLAPVALVRPSKDPAESVNFLWCSRHGSRLKVREGGLPDETQLRAMIYSKA